MDYQSASELIKKSSRIAVVIYEKAAADEIGTGLALISCLKKYPKEVDLFFSGVFPEEWKKVFPQDSDDLTPPNERAAGKKELKDFIIAVNTKEVEIGEIKYELQKNKDLYIILSPKNSPLKKENIRLLGNNRICCDCVMTVGIEGPEKFGREFEENPLLFSEKPIINIDISPKNELFGKINLVDTARISPAEIIYELIESIDPKLIGPEEAAKLLFGLIEKTENFKNAKTNPRTLEICASLAKAGGDKNLIVAALYKTKPSNLLQLLSRALVRTRFDGKTGRLWTLIPHEDFQKTGTETNALRFIISHIHEHFPLPKTYILLFENPEKNHIRAVAKHFSQETARKIGGKEEIDNQNDILVFKKSFSAFPEAETYVDKLLREAGI